MGIRVIGQKKFEVTETELLQQDLLFYLDNPRVYSVLHENGHDNPTQTEIEEIMCSLDHVKSLKSQIMQNGGLIEPLIVVKRKDTLYYIGQLQEYLSHTGHDEYIHHD